MSDERSKESLAAAVYDAAKKLNAASRAASDGGLLVSLDQYPVNRMGKPDWPCAIVEVAQVIEAK